MKMQKTWLKVVQSGLRMKNSSVYNGKLKPMKEETNEDEQYVNKKYF